jgi:hypothetical protein
MNITRVSDETGQAKLFTVALVCGMKDVMQQSRGELYRLGVDECDVLTNY